MRILVTAAPDLHKINPQRYHHLVRYLSERHQLTILGVNAWWLEKLEDEVVDACLKNTKYYYLSHKKRNPILQEFYSPGRLMALKDEIDLDAYDAHINLNSLIAGYYVTKMIPVPTVFDICDDLVNWVLTSQQVPKQLRYLGKCFAAHMLKRTIGASSLITYSTRQLKQQFEIPDAKSLLIPNGVYAPFFTDMSRYRKEAREGLHLSQEDFVLGFVGHLGSWVDFEPLFRIARDFEPSLGIRMVIVGGGPNLSALEAMAARYGIQENVLFVGNVSYREVPRYISSMDVCLLPFDSGTISQNALPLKIFEYMVCEKPVISTPLAGVREIFGDRVLYAGSVEEWREAVIKLHHCEDLRAALGSAGKEFVTRSYDWNGIFQVLDTKLRQLAGGEVP